MTYSDKLLSEILFRVMQQPEASARDIHGQLGYGAFSTTRCALIDLEHQGKIASRVDQDYHSQGRKLYRALSNGWVR